MRISKKHLTIVIGNINKYTNHKASVLFTQGCGVYVTIDGKEYSKKVGENEYMGISNKKAYEILEPYSQEAIQKALKNITKE